MKNLNASQYYNQELEEDEKDNFYQMCVQLMDDEIRENLHSELSPCSEDVFLEKYCEEHLEKFSDSFWAVKDGISQL